VLKISPCLVLNLFICWHVVLAYRRELLLFAACWQASSVLLDFIRYLQLAVAVNSIHERLLQNSLSDRSEWISVDSCTKYVGLWANYQSELLDSYCQVVLLCISSRHHTRLIMWKANWTLGPGPLAPFWIHPLFAWFFCVSIMVKHTRHY